MNREIQGQAIGLGETFKQRAKKAVALMQAGNLAHVSYIGNRRTWFVGSTFIGNGGVMAQACQMMGMSESECRKLYADNDASWDA